MMLQGPVSFQGVQKVYYNESHMASSMMIELIFGHPSVVCRENQRPVDDTERDVFWGIGWFLRYTIIL